MAKRKAHPLTTWLRISLLALVFISSSNAYSMSLERFGFDLGVSGSLLYSDLDGSQLALGSGYQASIFSTFSIGKNYLLKLQFDSVTQEQDFTTEANITASSALIQVQQRYHLLLLGAEIRRKTWFWEYFGGFNIGRNSSYKVKDLNSNSLSSGKDRTKNFLVAGAAIGYHWKVNKFQYIARMKTFTLLDNLYSNSLRDEAFFFSLPLQLSLGMEF